MTAEPRICARPDCDNPVVGRAGKKYCSTRCNTIVAKRKWKGGLFIPTEAICARLDCGRTFLRRSRISTFCSIKCGNVVATRQYRGTPLDGSHPARPCARCGVEFVPVGRDRIYCSPVCTARAGTAAYRSRNPKQPAPKPPKRRCEWCGSLFQPVRRDDGIRYCSRACGQESRQEEWTDDQRTRSRDVSALYNIRQRILSIGSGAEFDPSVTLTALIERDKGICWLCGKPCLERDGKRFIAPSYPTIDHVLPISAGGAHTWKNVRLAHKGCNREKFDDVCRACGGPISEIGEPLCASCVAKGRKAKVGFGVCRECGYVEMPGGFCSRCRAKGAGLWIATGLTRVKARALSREMGFEPRGLSLPVPPDTTGWVVWMVA